MGLIITGIIGLVAGAIAHRVLNSRGGYLGNLVVGLIGALIGGKLAEMFRLQITGGVLDQPVLATVGAILFLFVWRKLRS